MPCDAKDRDLFSASTIVTIGDGKTAEFWTSSWLHGQTAKNLAPTLFKKSKRKKILVHQATRNNRWVSHILPIQSEQELCEFVNLWEQITNVLSNVNRDDSMEDSITWRWTQDGEYTTQSAYQIQFEGTYSTVRWVPIWRAKKQFQNADSSHGLCYTKRFSPRTT